ncbi:MAG: OmpA/MotB family protein [Pseudomonadota bacterium]
MAETPPPPPTAPGAPPPESAPPIAGKGEMAQASGQAKAMVEQEGLPAQHAAKAIRNRPWQQAWDTSARDEIEDESGWLMTFGDLMSLLLVMFVFIVAFSSFEPERYAVSDAPHPAEGTGQPSVPADAPPADTPMPLTHAPKEPENAPLPELDPAFQSLGNDVQINVQSGQINLQIPDSILFAAGTANLSEAGLPLLDRIAEALKGNDYGISIEGHTDSIPIRNVRYPSNWELSSARAAIVLRYFIARGVAPERMRAIGYADTRPVVPNDTPESRARNRRVALVLHVSPPQESTRPAPTTP